MEGTSTLIDRLVGLADDDGCVELSELETLTEEMELDPDELVRLHEGLRDRGVALRDDCGREAPPTAYRNHALAETTTDANATIICASRTFRGGAGVVDSLRRMPRSR